MDAATLPRLIAVFKVKEKAIVLLMPLLVVSVPLIGPIARAWSMR